MNNEIFDLNPSLDVYHQTEDGTPFFNKSDAQAHANKIGGDVITHHRSKKEDASTEASEPAKDEASTEADEPAKEEASTEASEPVKEEVKKTVAKRATTKK